MYKRHRTLNPNMFYFKQQYHEAMLLIQYSLEAAEMELLISQESSPQRVFVTSVDGRSSAPIVRGWVLKGEEEVQEDPLPLCEAALPPIPLQPIKISQHGVKTLLLISVSCSYRRCGLECESSGAWSRGVFIFACWGLCNTVERLSVVTEVPEECLYIGNVIPGLN